jgi:small subunit ribosomal protein S20
VAHSLSAKKRIRQSLKRRARNRARKEQVKTDVKSFLTALGTGDVNKAREALNVAVSRMDRVATKRTIHKNAAARKRSRLQRRLNALVASGATAKTTTTGRAATGRASKTTAGKGSKATKA